MNERFFVLALIAGLAACGKKAPTTAPPPDTGSGTPAPAPAPPPPPPASTGTNPSTGAGEAERTRLLQVLQQPIYFDYDQDAIRSGPDQQVLDQKASILLANPSVQVMIAGHTDDRGSDEYNLVLGSKRAAAAKRYLESKGIDGSRIKTVSYGEERPTDSSGTEAAFTKNRRDEFDISGAERLVSPK